MLREVYKLQAFRVRTHSDRVRTSMIKTTSCFYNSFKNLHVLHVPVGFLPRSDPVRTGSERVRTGPNVSTEVYKLQAFRVRTHSDRVRTSMTNTTSCFCNFYKSLAFYQSHCGSLHVRTLSEQVRMGPPRYINYMQFSSGNDALFWGGAPLWGQEVWEVTPPPPPAPTPGGLKPPGVGRRQ